MIKPLKAWFKKRVLAAILVIALLIFPSYQYFDFENRFYDFQVKLRVMRVGQYYYKADDSVVLIGLDDNAVRFDADRLLRSSSEMTSRAYLAKLIAKVAAQKPKVIALDFLLDEPSNKVADDNALIRALETVRTEKVPIVMATRIEQSAEVKTPVLPLPVFLRLFEIDNNLFLGHVNLETFRADGVVRDVLPAKMLAPKATAAGLFSADDVYYYYEDQKAYYSLSFPLQILRAAEAAEVASGKDVSHILDALVYKGPLRIDFTTDDGKLLWISSAAVLKGLSLNSLTNKVVVIGSAFSRSPDKMKTPLSRETFLVPGVAILDKLQPDMFGARLHVYALRTLGRAGHGERFIKMINDWVLVLVFLFAGSIIGPLYLRYDRKRIFFVLVGLGLVGYFLLHLVLFQYYLVYLPLVRPMGAALVVIAFFVLLKGIPDEQINTDVEGDGYE